MEQKMLVGWFSDYRVILGTQMERHFFFTDGRTQSHSYSPFRPHEYCTTVKHIEQLISNNIVTCYFDHIIKVYLCSGSAGPTLHCMVGCPEFWCWRPLLEPSVRRRGGERETRIRFQTIYIHLLPTVDTKHAFSLHKILSTFVRAADLQEIHYLDISRMWPCVFSKDLLASI